MLTIYRIISRLIEMILRLRVRISGSEALRQRLLLDSPSAPADIWIHGASVGELTSARPIIQALAADFSLLVTANSQTGRDMVAEWGLPICLAPLDVPGALDRFLNAVQPRLALTVEAEIWPLRSRMLADRGIPQAVIGARMSERSAQRWARLRGLISPVLGRIAAFSAQDEDSEARLRQLGLPASAILPRLDLKLLAPAQVVPPADDPARDMTVLAASTHEGEDAPILDAWLAARAAHPDLRLILAPRHPQRGADIAALIAARGLDVMRRSDGAGDAPLLLADTLGEMPRWYAMAGICFVGGSLTDIGGHTPWEPAAYRCAILHGPHVDNHAANYAALAEAGAALPVDARTLGAELVRLAGDPAAAHRMGKAAQGLLKDRAGDPVPLLNRLRDLAKSGGAYDI
ncbi:3-deoxy-D-manno-octulosonic acid transferase [Paracoccus onubensis]|nr:glycosyltransferase N-terminal domain-containing protein [Paracoccus onubensis]